ncbi:MAG: hypothetical protein F6K34_04810 [Okeania sp. SIO4D6]|nr:hypothetical protein [Okeania sp. SIO4D6]
MRLRFIKNKEEGRGKKEEGRRQKAEGGGLTKSEVRSQKSEVRSYFFNGDLTKIFRLKRRVFRPNYFDKELIIWRW